MSGINIPRDPLAGPSPSTPTVLSSPASPQPLTAPVDTFGTTAAGNHTRFSVTPSTAPPLALPEVTTVSSSDYFKVISEAALAFLHQLGASDRSDQAFREKNSERAANQILGLQDMLNERTQALQRTAADTDNAVAQLEQKTKEMQNETAQMQQQIDQINRSKDPVATKVKAYQNAIAAYNQQVDQNNQDINALLNTYHLQDVANSIGIPRQKSVDSSQSGSPPFPSLNPASPPTFNTAMAHKVITNTLVNERVTQLNQAIIQYVQFWQMSQNHEIPTSDSLLNTKTLAAKILPDATTTPSQVLTSDGNTGTMSPLQAFGINNPQVISTLGQTLLDKTLKDSKLEDVNQKNTKELEVQTKTAIDQLLSLSLSMMSNQSQQALLPSLGPLAQKLASLPADSPAYALLFAVSFANRVQEDVIHGGNKEALQALIEGNPALQNLSRTDQEKLEAILNLGQSLVALKMLETSLGLPGLTAQILSLLAAIDKQGVIKEGVAEQKDFLTQMQQDITHRFLNEGYPKDAAQFLGQVGKQLAEEGTLTPSATSIPSAGAINQSLLRDSVKAALVLSNIPLQKAEQIAQQAVDRTLDETPYPSTKLLRANLASHLQDAGIRDQGREIAQQAVIIPTKEVALAWTPQTAARPNLSAADIAPLVEKQSLQLLAPQLGLETAKQATGELMKTLFGTTHPGETARTEAIAPYSLVNVIRNQLYHLHKGQDQTWAHEVSGVFKETIKSMESFNAFAQRLMNPAYQLVYVGLIYGDQGIKKPLDIQI